MVSVKEVPANKLVFKLKEELKKVKELEPPAWAGVVKSGAHRERAPEQDDFWYIRLASILRRISIEEMVGVPRLRTYFGGRRRRGYKPARFRKAGGSMIRRALQKLEAAGLVEKNAKRKGRKLTKAGQKLVNKMAYEVSKE